MHTLSGSLSESASLSSTRSKRTSSSVPAIDLHTLRILSYAFREDSASEEVGRTQVDAKLSIRCKTCITSFTESTFMSVVVSDDLQGPIIDVLGALTAEVRHETDLISASHIGRPNDCVCLLSTQRRRYYVS